jgi:hypothetical protein
VSAADGHALQGATVRIVNTKTQQAVASTLSGEDGSFEFTKLKADKYSLDAVTGGYLVSPYDEHDNFSSAIVTGAGVDTESLILRITPADGWTLEWGKREVLARYLPKGVPVTVSASEQQSLQLAADLIAQPR